MNVTSSSSSVVIHQHHHIDIPATKEGEIHKIVLYRVEDRIFIDKEKADKYVTNETDKIRSDLSKRIIRIKGKHKHCYLHEYERSNLVIVSYRVRLTGNDEFTGPLFSSMDEAMNISNAWNNWNGKIASLTQENLTLFMQWQYPGHRRVYVELFFSDDHLVT